MNNYSIKLCVGRGNFGDVYKAHKKKTGEFVAIKVINLETAEEDVSATMQEINMLCSMRSIYITRYFEAFVKNMSLLIVMEYCGGGSCSDLLKCHKKLSEEVTSHIIRSVTLGINYLHGQKKVHRDIKAANILLTNEGEVKIADFGVSSEITFTRKKMHTFVGTPFWMAPEVIKRRSEGYDQKADIWSIGITTIELVTGFPPMSSMDPMKAVFQIPDNTPPNLDSISYLSLSIKEFVKLVLKKDPKERPTSKKLLQHKFLRIRRGLSLVSLIETKNKWMDEKYAKGRKPKHYLDLESFASDIKMEEPSGHELVEWDFNTGKGCKSNKVPSAKSSAITSNLLHTNGEGGESPNTKASTPAPSPAMFSAKLASKSYLNEIVLVCLERVIQRAKTVETKMAVEHLGQNFITYEGQQPGMCEAIVEEICLYVNELIAT